MYPHVLVNTWGVDMLNIIDYPPRIGQCVGGTCTPHVLANAWGVDMLNIIDYPPRIGQCVGGT